MNKKRFFTALLTLLTFSSVLSQVGINTTTPSPGSVLDVESSDKGILVPRVNILDLTTIAPVTGGATESLLVYNTSTSTGPGFFYWDGTEWIAIGTNAPSNDWTLEGNTGTTPGTGAGENFVGTTDNTNFMIGTNSTSALSITNTQRIAAHNSGTEALPTYRFANDADTGIWRSGANRLNFSSGGRETLELSTGRATFNENANNIDLVVETVNDSRTLFVDGALDDVGIGTGTPSARLEVRQNDATAEAAITRFTSNGNRTLDILQPANTTDPFTFQTDNALEFRIDNTDRLNIAASGEIGINNTNPQTDLHVGGANNTIRVDAFSAANNANNDGTRTIPLHADADGNLLLPTSPTSAAFIYNELDPIPLTPVQTGTNGGLVVQIIHNTGNFTLTQRALISINYASGFIITNTGGTSIDDPKAKLIRTRLNIMDAGSNTLIERGGHDSVSYTNQGGVGTVSIGGFFNTAGSTAVLLDPGTYRVDLEVNVGANGPNNGTTSDAFLTQWIIEHLKVIAHY